MTMPRRFDRRRTGPIAGPSIPARRRADGRGAPAARAARSGIGVLAAPPASGGRPARRPDGPGGGAPRQPARRTRAGRRTGRNGDRRAAGRFEGGCTVRQPVGAPGPLRAAACRTRVRRREGRGRHPPDGGGRRLVRAWRGAGTGGASGHHPPDARPATAGEEWGPACRGAARGDVRGGSPSGRGRRGRQGIGRIAPAAFRRDGRGSARQPARRMRARRWVGRNGDWRAAGRPEGGCVGRQAGGAPGSLRSATRRARVRYRDGRGRDPWDAGWGESGCALAGRGAGAGAASDRPPRDPRPATGRVGSGLAGCGTAGGRVRAAAGRPGGGPDPLRIVACRTFGRRRGGWGPCAGDRPGGDGRRPGGVGPAGGLAGDLPRREGAGQSKGRGEDRPGGDGR